MAYSEQLKQYLGNNKSQKYMNVGLLLGAGSIAAWYMGWIPTDQAKHEVDKAKHEMRKVKDDPSVIKQPERSSK